MQKFKYDMLYEIAPPTLVLSTRYHKKLGVIENVAPNITSRFTMSSHQEISFDVYKTLDNVVCSLWDEIVDFKYVYVPEHNEYYEIQVDIDDSNNTIKHCVGKSAGECELSQRYLRDFHCNDETDILMDDYVVTVLYDPDNPKGSLLNRVLADKCPDWSIGYVDENVAKIQRTFNADNTTIYDFLVNTVATEIGVLFKFDSVNRVINVYDLWNTCNECGHRSDFVMSCPNCGSRSFTRGYGKWTSIYISPENFAESITIDGDADNVKNCFKISGGDDLITATVANLNPNGSNYIYRFSQDAISDMPDALKNRLSQYNKLYDSYLPTYQKLVDEYYKTVDEELEYHTKMMPEADIPDNTSAQEQLDILINLGFTVAVQDLNTVSVSSADLSVEGYARAIVDPRYTVKVFSSSLSPLNVSTNTRTWTGMLTVKSLGGLNKDGEEDTATTTSTVDIIVNGDYEEFLRQKIEKTLDRSDASFTTIFNIEDDTAFKEALHLYSLDRLQSFSHSYQDLLEVLTKQNVPETNAVFFNVELYNEIYMPYYTRKGWVDEELLVREKQVEVLNDKINDLTSRMKTIKDLLNLRAYLGEDMYRIFILYLREDTYSNSNYISTGLDNPEVIKKAQELLQVAQAEIQKASELQYTLSGNLINLMNTEEFADFKDDFEIGDWIMCRAGDKLFRLRLLEVEYDYSDKATINVTFSNAFRVNDMISDVADILSRASSMATTYDYVAHQASQGDAANTFVEVTKSNGISAEDIQISAGNNKDIIIDEHGIWAKYFDDAKGEYSPKQLHITSNMIAFTKDNWKTTEAALGEHSYERYDPATDSYIATTDYGLSANFVIAGYISGSTIVSGDIYSDNYSSYDMTGTHLDLKRGYFSFAGGDFKYDQNGLSYRGEIITRSLNIDDQTDISITHNNMEILTTTVDIDNIEAQTSTLSAYQVGFSNGYGLFVPYHGLFQGEVEANTMYSHGDIYAMGNMIGDIVASQSFIKANTDMYAGHESGDEHIINLTSNAGTIKMFSEATNADLKGMRATNAQGQSVDIFTVNQQNEVTFNGTLGVNDIVLSGISDPHNGIGRENSVYLKYRSANVSFLNPDDYTHTTIELNTFEDKGGNVYDISLYGYPSSSADEINFVMDGLTEGDEYTITFTFQFAEGTTFPWTGYNSSISVFGTGVVSETTIFSRDTDEHEYSLTFVAGSTNQLKWAFSDVNDGVRFDCNITNLTFVDNTSPAPPIENVDISDIFGKIDGEWLHYVGNGSGGSSVIPNPQGEPTDTLSTIEIDGTIFDIEGSGGGISDEVIFTDTTGTTGTRNITLTKSLNNFDAVYFEWFGTSEEQYAASHVSPVYPIEANNNGNVSVVCYPTYGNRYIVLTGDPTSTSVSLQSGTWDTVPLSVYKIHGIKFKGGGSSSVIPNPQGEATDTLTTIEIDGTVYDIAGSGGGGSAYRETTLWSGSDSASMTLSESFENYDAVMLVGKNTYNNVNYSISGIWLTSYLKAHINDGMRFGLANDSWYVYFSITNDTTFVRQDQYSVYISEIKGLKFGGGVGSEIIPISAGDGTTSRTFTFDKTPKFIAYYWNDPVLEGNGWNTTAHFVWGQEFVAYSSATNVISINNNYQGCMHITYNGNSITFTGGNAFSVCNTTTGSGYMYVDYGGGSGGGSSSGATKDVLYSDPNGAPHLTWLQLAHNFTDYDVIYLKISNPSDIGDFNLYTHHSFMPMMYNTNERVSIQGLYGTRVVDIAFDGASFEIVRTDGDYQNNTVYEIVGIKY